MYCDSKTSYTSFREFPQMLRHIVLQEPLLLTNTLVRTIPYYCMVWWTLILGTEMILRRTNFFTCSLTTDNGNVVPRFRCVIFVDLRIKQHTRSINVSSVTVRHHDKLNCTLTHLPVRTLTKELFLDYFATKTNTNAHHTQTQLIIITK
jgi:hypothetical protein